MNAEIKADAHQRPTNADAGLTKFDPSTLRAIATSDTAMGVTALVPKDMAQAMELAKLMSASNFVPPHLRGKSGDCLAVVLQSMRWGADPYAVGSKTYFVQDRIAYEAQLVNAVVNTRAPLEGRLHVEWDGEGALLTCKVTGRIKGDPTPHTIWQEIGTITTKNSPLWKQSPRQQLAYYTTRMWARLFCPEVLLGIYTPDEIGDIGTITQDDGSSVMPPRPTRQSARDDGEAARKAAADMDNQYRATMGRETVDEETGEVTDDAPVTLTKADAIKFGPQIKKGILGLESLAKAEAFEEEHADALAAIKEHLPTLHAEIVEMLTARTNHLGNRK